MADPLVTLADAKTDLRIDGDDHDARISLHIVAAQAWLYGYVNLPAPPIDEAARAAMKSAMLLRLRDLFSGAGEGPDTLAARHLVDPWRNLRV